MVQLSSYPNLDSTVPSSPSVELLVDCEDSDTGGSLKVDSPNTLQVCLQVSTAYYGYETYIEDGLICLKHKVRNLEKKKQKLEDYKKRMSQGEVLNKDQLAAVEKYEELMNNLSFTRELHQTLDCLTTNLLRGQEKAVKRERVARMEMERRRLTLVLQMQHLLSSLQQEHVQRDLLSGHNQAPHVSAQKLHSLNQLAAQLGVKPDRQLSLEEQMEQATLVYLDLVEGKDKPVAGSSFRLLKEELTRLLDDKYFSSPPSPPHTPEGSWSLSAQGSLQSKPNDVSRETEIEKVASQTWQKDFRSSGRGELPESWQTEFSDSLSSQHLLVQKPWRGAATFIPKMVPAKKKPADCKQRKERKSKVDQNAKFAVDMDLPMEVLSSPCAFPIDPVMRKQHLEDLMTKIHSSFSFMQESLLDGETCPSSGDPRGKRETSQSPSSLVQPAIRSLTDVLPKPLHSTPLPTRLLMHKAGLSNREDVRETCDRELFPNNPPNGPIPLSERKTFPSPTLYRRDSSFSCLENPCTPWKEAPCNGVESCTLTPPHGQTFLTPPARKTLTAAQFQSIHSVCKMNASSPQKLATTTDCAVSTDLRRNTVGTQTPPEFAPPEEEFLSGGSLVPPTSRDVGPLPCPLRGPGHQHGYRPEGRQSSHAWNDSFHTSNPDHEGTFTIVDSGLGDSMSVSTEEVPLTPHSPDEQSSPVPMWLYSLSQPMRVAFTASRTANFAPGNLDQPIVFDQLYSNLGGMYDAHIGRFTCPVNGTYVFIFHILKLAINMPLYINLMHNEEVIVSAYANDGAPDHETASNHAILPLFQGDQVWLRLHRGAIYGSSWKYSTFSGFLLYQD